MAATLVAAGPLFSGLHYLEVGHYNCPEHHELIHVGSLTAPGLAPSAGAGLAAERRASAADGLPGHAHCDLQPFARHDAEPVHGLVLASTVERWFEAAPAAVAEPTPPLACLALAPKHSPPSPTLA